MLSRAFATRIILIEFYEGLAKECGEEYSKFKRPKAWIHFQIQKYSTQVHIVHTLRSVTNIPIFPFAHFCKS